MTALFSLHLGDAPLLVSLPHVGTEIPVDLAPRLVPRALQVEHTDWHLAEIYDFARALGASILVPRYSRFLVDLNRPPDNLPMYPGANNTELCPTRFFDGEPLYRPGQAPTDADVQWRVRQYWQPYHDALSGELARQKRLHGRAMLWEGHSIESSLPWLFEGPLPDLNLGTTDGASCVPALRQQLMQVLAAQSRFSHVTDGRFKGGYNTRHYGRPADGVQAVQMEMCFRTYMRDERAPWPLDWPRVREHLQPVLRQLLETMLAWRPGA